MYSNTDIISLDKKHKIYIGIIIIFSLISIVAMGIAFNNRYKALCCCLSIICFSVLSFFISLVVLPNYRYKKAINYILNGKKKTIKAKLKQIDNTLINNDNIFSNRLVFLDESIEEEFILYLDIYKYDINKLVLGKHYDIEYHERQIVNISL